MYRECPLVKTSSKTLVLYGLGGLASTCRWSWGFSRPQGGLLCVHFKETYNAMRLGLNI